jgi:hypothetical protein
MYDKPHDEKKARSEGDAHILADAIKQEKIRRAVLAGPSCITREATVAEMDREGNLSVLRAGTNDWVYVPGDQNVIGSTDMCLDPMGMVWMKDVMAKKPRPINTSPGLIYMLNGATQHSYTDPFDTTSPAIPIDPHRSPLDDPLAVRCAGRWT